MEYRKKKRNREDEILEIPGMFFDRELNRYFPWSMLQNTSKNYSEYLDKKQKVDKIVKYQWHNTVQPHRKSKENDNKNSNFMLIWKSKVMFKVKTVDEMNRKNELISKHYALDKSTPDKSSATVIYKGKYYITLHQNDNESYIFIAKISTHVFMKKLFLVSRIYDSWSITNNNTLVLISNINTIQLIYNSSFTNWLNLGNDYKTSNNWYVTKELQIKIKNKNKIPMLYNWPIVRNYPQCDSVYFIWIYHLIFIIKLNLEEHTPWSIKNNESAIINFNTGLKPVIIHEQVFNEGFSNFVFCDTGKRWIAFSAKSNKLFILGNVNKLINKESGHLSILKIIENDRLTQVVEAMPFQHNSYLLSTSTSSLFHLNTNNYKITQLYQAEHSNNLCFKSGRFHFKYPFIVFVNEDNEIIWYSIHTFSIVKRFKPDMKVNNIWINEFTNEYILMV